MSWREIFLVPSSRFYPLAIPRLGVKKTPDEVIHLAAGLQFSGFKSVVGTLWEVDDSVAKHVVEAFYKYMFHPKEEGVMDCTKAAWALNCTTHAVKTKAPVEQQMVFVHIGVQFYGVLLSPGIYSQTVYLRAILFRPDVQMTLITIFLHSSYLVLVYVFVFCRLECLYHMREYIRSEI
jgi:hypothetical protein